MGIKKALKALIGKDLTNASDLSEKTPEDITYDDLFPVIQMPESDIQRYHKIPLDGLAALGAAFSQLPDAARTIVQTKTTSIATKETLFVGINSKGIPGFLRGNQYGTTGNIIQVNSQGKQVIAGRMRFKPIDSMPVNETTITKLPVDPTLMVIAVAVMAIEQRLDKIQESVEEVLRFLELEKQSKQRGSLRKISEIVDDYKIYCNDDSFCSGRNQIVQTIQLDALRDIEFYQEKVSIALRKTKSFHTSQEANTFLNTVLHEFSEYQLACYIYAYCCFLDVMLRKDFSESTVSNNIAKMKAMGEKYDSLYAACHEQIFGYQKTSVESKLLDGIGVAVSGIGKAIGSIPIVRDGSFDEALIEAGKNIGAKKEKTITRKMESVDSFADNRMESFIESLHSVDSMVNNKNAVLTDGDNLYILKD